MAEIIGNDHGGGKHQKKRAKKGHVHMDMTPMVDLAFLLLTFFILATTLSKPKTMEIVYPKEQEEIDKKTKIKDELATTVLLGEELEDIFYYNGKFKPDTTELEKSDLSKDGLRKVFFERNKNIVEEIKTQEERLKRKEINDSTFKALRKAIKGDSLAPFVIIKTLDSTYYKAVIDVIDDLNIANIGKYAIQDMAETEEIALRQTLAKEK